MARNLSAIVFVVLLAAFATAPGHAVGEDFLALQGQYTFFIQPDPTSHVTYYQRLVPCIETKTVPIPRRIVETFPVPVPDRRRQPIIVSETPVGCAEGSGPCVECFPRPSTRPGVKEVTVPRYLPVRVPGIAMVPRDVTRRVMRPQWFAVRELPKPPPAKIRKVADGR